jgi:hypothetical protein
MKTVYDYCNSKNIFSSETKCMFEQTIANFKGVVKMSKDIFVNVNSGFVTNCIDYYSEPAIMNDMVALIEVSKENKMCLEQIKTAFSTVHRYALQVAEKFGEISALMYKDLKVYEEEMKTKLKSIQKKIEAATAEMEKTKTKIENL